MARTQKSSKRIDGHTQKYNIGTDRVVPLADARTPSAHAVAASPNPAEFAPDAELADFSDLVSIPSGLSDSDVSVDQTGMGGFLYRDTIDLDRRTGDVRAYSTYLPHSDGTWTQAEQGGLVTGWAFSNPLTGEDKDKLLESIASDLGKLVAGFTEVWNGNNFVAEDSDIDGESMDDVRARIEAAFDNVEDESWVESQQIADDEADLEFANGVLDEIQARAEHDGTGFSYEYDGDQEWVHTLTDDATGQTVSASFCSNDSARGDAEDLYAELRQNVENDFANKTSNAMWGLSSDADNEEASFTWSTDSTEHVFTLSDDETDIRVSRRINSAADIPAESDSLYRELRAAVNAHVAAESATE